MFKPVIQKLPPAPKPNIDRINSFKGINVSVDPTQLEYNESPDMLNMTLDTEGALDKRTGYAKLFPTPLSGTVWSAFTYRKLDDTVEYLLHAGTGLYSLTLNGSQPVEITGYNLLPPFSEWTNANPVKATITSQYELNINNTANELVYVEVPCTVGQVYTLSYALLEPSSQLYFRNSGGTELGTTSGTGGQYTAPVGAVIIGVRFYDSSGTSKRVRNPQLQTGSVATTFKPKARIANARSNMFAMNGKVYIQDGTNYLEYDGTTVHEPSPYVPTLFISTSHAGGGAAFEDANLLTPKFKQSFSADGTTLTYQMAVTGLDAAPVIGSYDGVNFNKVEGTDFTVNRATGVITTTTAVTKGTNTVIFQAEKLVAGNKQKITKCKNARMFGGTNDTRVFMWDGNILYRSDIYRPNYFPENAYQKIGGDDDIQNMVIQYDSAVIEKEFSKWSLRYDDSTGKALFPVRPINDTVGSIAPLSSQLIENAPVTLTRNGVYTLAGGSVRDERNVQQISKRIDKLLLAEPNLKNAITIDFDQKYMIFLNSNVYVWDYRLNEWYPWDNFPATSVWEIDSRLYFGDSAGNVYYMKKHGEQNAYSDVAQAIKWHWHSKNNSYGMDERRKLVEKVVITMKPDIASSCELYYVTDQVRSPMVANPRMDMFSYEHVNYARFTYNISSSPQTVMTKIKAKKIVNFQLLIQGNAIDESFGLLSINTIYSQQSLVK